MTLLTLGRRLGAAAAMLALVAALSGCSSSDAASTRPSPAASSTQPREHGAPLELVSAALEDTVEERPDDRIAWTTSWRACFAPAEGEHTEVDRWEARVVTTEGISPELQELPSGCLDIDVATGVNAADAGTPGREVQLSDAQRLAYQVRVVRTDGTASPWTDRVLVGTVAPS